MKVERDRGETSKREEQTEGDKERERRETPKDRATDRETERNRDSTVRLTCMKGKIKMRSPR